MEVFVQILLLIVGFALLVKGADWFVDGASGVATKAKISQIVIGLTICAFGTSAPEAAVSISAAVTGTAGITVGNVLGSNVTNIFLILGLSAVIRPMTVQKNSLWIEIPFLMLITGIFILLGYFGNDLTRLDGGILIAFFALFMIYLFLMAKKQRTALIETAPERAVAAAENAVRLDAAPGTSEIVESGAGEPQLSGYRKFKAGWAKLETHLWFLILLTVVGLGMVVGGSILAVEAAKTLAETAGVSERVIGLTIVALGTSLPELVTSVVAAAKGNSDIAIGNIIGSNIFNLLFVAGLSALIMPIPYDPAFLWDGLISLAAAAVLFVSVLFKSHKLGRIAGSAMLVCFVGYYLYLFLV